MENWKRNKDILIVNAENGILCKETIVNIGESSIQVVGEEMSPKFCSFIQ